MHDALFTGEVKFYPAGSEEAEDWIGARGFRSVGWGNPATLRPAVAAEAK